MRVSPLARAAFLAALLAASGARAQEDKPVSVACKLPPARAKTPLLRLEGTAPFQDGVVLKITVHRLQEQSLNGRLAPTAMEVDRGLAEVREGKFLHEPGWDGPGLYRVAVDLIDDYQRPSIVQSLRKKPGARRWSFEFPAWREDLASQLGQGLQEVDRITAEAVDLVRKFEAACATPADWHGHQKTLVREADVFRAKLERIETTKLYPASVGQIVSTFRSIVGNVPYFAWREGKFTAISYHTKDQPVKTFRQEEFTYINLRRYVEEARALAGREFALWGVKEIRRGGKRESLSEAIKAHPKQPGLEEFAERLEKAAPEELDPLEKEIRGAK